MYEAKIKIGTETNYRGDTHYVLNTDFSNGEPREKEIYFTLNNNVTYHGQKMPKSHFNNVLDDVKMTVTAVFNKNFVVNDLASSLSPALPYDDFLR